MEGHLAGREEDRLRPSGPAQARRQVGSRVAGPSPMTVTVLDDGFQFEDRRYNSLSMIAREITGVRWSGPRFFGLRSNGRAMPKQRDRSKDARCAIYTRKSTKRGSSRTSTRSMPSARPARPTSEPGHEGWTASGLLRRRRLSGATMERPALQRLLGRHQPGKRIDTVVVYKVDRLTRSLADFAKIVEVFDATGSRSSRSPSSSTPRRRWGG
jgi:hypothetical protein